MRKNLIESVLTASIGVASIGVVACTDSKTPVDGRDNDMEDAAGAKGDAGKDTSDSGAPGVYGIGSLVFGDPPNDYLVLVDSLALKGVKLDLEQAREFPGQGDLATHEGSILAASGDEPTIVKYEVEDDLSLTQGTSVSFAKFGIASAAFWNNQFVAAEKAYMVNGATELIVWNPQTMEIEGTIDLPTLGERDGFRVVTGLADRSSVVHDGKFYLPLYWTDEDYAYRSDDSVIVVVDIATDTVEDTISAACPGLDYATVDDDDKIHFSNWTGGVGTYYVLETAQNCIATVDPETQAVTTKSFASIADGHEGAAFKYAGNGRFVMSVFDELRADIANAEEPFAPVGGLNWQLWSYDPATGDSAAVEGVDWNSGAIIHTRIDDQLYSMVPGADYTTTVVYAVDDASAERVFSVDGWSFRLFRVR